MSWTALIPLKPHGARKTRLAACLAPSQRDALSDAFFTHVAAVLAASPSVSRVVLLSATQGSWRGEWLCDRGRGLNTELMAARVALGAVPLVVIHADLPLLAPADIERLVAGAECGCAIAPDRHGQGTNGIALAAGHPFQFAFGPDSLQRHLRQGPAACVRRNGLALDIDLPEDMAEASRRGAVPSLALCRVE